MTISGIGIPSCINCRPEFRADGGVGTSICNVTFGCTRQIRNFIRSKRIHARLSISHEKPGTKGMKRKQDEFICHLLGTKLQTVTTWRLYRENQDSLSDRLPKRCGRYWLRFDLAFSGQFSCSQPEANGSAWRRPAYLRPVRPRSLGGCLSLDDLWRMMSGDLQKSTSKPKEATSGQI